MDPRTFDDITRSVANNVNRRRLLVMMAALPLATSSRPVAAQTTCAAGQSLCAGVCVDTCHVFAAGYPLGTEKDYRATIKALDATVGVERVRAFHLNDSRAKFGSRVDRHAHIGRGEMGLEPFRFLLADRRFRRVPMYLETPKGSEDGQDLDVANLAVLRGLIAG